MTDEKQMKKDGKLYALPARRGIDPNQLRLVFVKNIKSEVDVGCGGLQGKGEDTGGGSGEHDDGRGGLGYGAGAQGVVTGVSSADGLSGRAGAGLSGSGDDEGGAGCCGGSGADEA